MSTLVLSDVHMCEVMDGNGTWMPYRQRSCVVDRDIASLIDDAVSSDASLEIVFNGDLFDFNAPDMRVVTAPQVPPSMSHDEAGAVTLISNILDHHPVFVDAVRRAIASGATVVFISGNHDAQLAFPAVRQVIASRLGDVSFRSWFHHTDGFHIEHGHQYDPLCALESMLPSSVDGCLKLEETIESVSSYYLQPLFDGMDPYSTNVFNVSPVDLFKATYSCATGGGDSRACWYALALIDFIRQIALNNPQGCSPSPSILYAARSETNAQLESLRNHQSLFTGKMPLEQFMANDGWKSYGRNTGQSLRSAAVDIASIYGARGVVMGHTHRPYGMYTDGVFYGNTGSWSPSARSFIWISGGTAKTYSGAHVAR